MALVRRIDTRALSARLFDLIEPPPDKSIRHVAPKSPTAPEAFRFLHTTTQTACHVEQVSAAATRRASVRKAPSSSSPDAFQTCNAAVGIVTNMSGTALQADSLPG